jgi:membrane associated rhomboid family serine protease
MSFGNSTQRYRIGGPVSPAVKTLLIINFAVFIIQQFCLLLMPGVIDFYFGLSYAGLVQHHFIWQIFTYMFLHGGWLHIFFNMFALWMFAGDLEQQWGTKSFVRYYLLSGLGAGVFIALMNWFFTVKYPGMAEAPTVGASGALYALLLAYGILWPNREVLVWFLFPVKMKYVVLFFGLFEFFGTLNSMSGVQGNISHIGHIGGLITGFILLKLFILRNKRSRPVVYGKKSSSYFAKLFRSFRLRKKRKEINTRIKAKETIDILLDKIAHHGMESLTPQERRDLEWARKHYYPSGDETIH